MSVSHRRLAWFGLVLLVLVVSNQIGRADQPGPGFGVFSATHTAELASGAVPGSAARIGAMTTMDGNGHAIRGTRRASDVNTKAGSVPAKGAAKSTLPYGIVYVRVPRSDRMLHLTKAEAKRSSKLKPGDPIDASFLDKLPEVSHILGGFNAPGQLVWRHVDGQQTIIFDCVNGMPSEGVTPPRKNGDDVCVPSDPVVSFDGTKVAFAVYHGKAEKKRHLRQSNSGETWRLSKPTWAGIYIYNLQTGKLSHWKHRTGVWDTAPVWLPDHKMMFTSTRGGVYARHSVWNQSRQPILQLWIANRDGSDAHNVGTQNQDDVLHPIVHSSGRVLFSIHEVPFARYWDRPGHAGYGPATVNNVWWLESVDLRGGNLHAHMGTHDFNNKAFFYKGKRLFGSSIRATHFLGELSNGDACTDDYYRGNNMGGGRILCWPARQVSRTPLGREGPYPLGLPEGAYIALDGTKADDFGKKIRDPAGVPDGKLLFAGALGTCHFTRNLAKIAKYTQKNLAGELGNTCDMGIYEKKPLSPGFNPNKDPGQYNDAIEIVNSPHWHEFMPKAVLPYKAIYGVDEPQQPPLSDTGDSDTSYGIFASVDVRKGNLRAAHGWQGPKDGRWCHFQGCALQAPKFLTHKRGDDFDTVHKIEYLRFWRVVPLKKPKAPLSWKRGHTLANTWGQRVILMGDVPVQADGSFKSKLPADTPFLMAGVDAQGRSIARHQHVMALRPGEKQVCSGCHLHATTDAENAKHSFTRTVAAKKPAVQPHIRWPNENPEPEWKADIYPLLKHNCASCHDGTANAPDPNFAQDRKKLYEDLTNYFGRSHSNYPVSHPKTENGDRAAVPWLTRYINALFPRESLLYWKAAGKRMDGRTDAARNDDFNFGRDHESHLTAAELRELSDWIEEGLYCNTDKNTCGTGKRHR